MGVTCAKNQLSFLDASGCIFLVILVCVDNRLSALDVSKNIQLQYLSCENNLITSLDLSNTKIKSWDSKEDDDNDYSLECDSNVTVIWARTTSKSSLSSITSHNIKDLMTVASIPPFTATHTGEYVFKVSFDKTTSEGDTLFLLGFSDSEDLQGFFIGDDGEEIKMPISESLDHIRVTAEFETGKTYAPVIVATPNAQDLNSGGCNVGAWGIMIFLAGMFLMKK